MKRISLIIVAIVPFCVCQCSANDPVPDLSPIAIYGGDLSGRFELMSYNVDRKTNTMSFEACPTEFYFASSNPDPLWMSVYSGKLSKQATKEEAFAFERIVERNKPLNEAFDEYKYRVDEWRGGTFVSAYVTGIPVITATGKLFGKEAGTDLSSQFLFGDKNNIGIIGMDYSMEERQDLKGNYVKAEDYFIDDRMLPFTICFQIVDIPEEITLEELPVIRYVGDDIIKVSILIPVRIEHYWAWCMELYNKPDSIESFSSGVVSITVPLVRKQ